MNNSIPKNLTLLHKGEEELREKALEFVQADAELPMHLDITERAMDLLKVFVCKQLETTDDGRALQHMAIRVFNAFATAWKLTSTGYHQMSGMVLRDIIETVYLVNHFENHPEQISIWRCADKKQLMREFSPSIIREALDEFSGQGRSRRHEIYGMFCSLAAHPSLAGFAMLKPKGMDAHIGPFMDITALQALLEEQGHLAIQAGFAFLHAVDKTVEPAKGVTHRFLSAAMDYSDKFLGKKYTQAEKLEVDELFLSN